MLAIGLAGVALRDAVPHVFSIVLSNTLVVAALVMSYRSLRAFRGPPPADYVGWSLVVVVFAALWLLLDVWPNLGARIAVLSAVRAFLLGRNAIELGRDVPGECRLSFGFTRTVFWVAAIAMVLRGFSGGLQPPQGDFMAPNPVNALPYLLFSCVSVAATLGVFWMVVQLLQAELVRQATRDALTHLLNRPAFMAEFEREASRSQRAGANFSLAVFDIDRFKALNDLYGHPAGDQALQLVAAAMRKCLRRHDVLGRFGGEEFALLMPEADKATALVIAERIRAEVAGLVFSQGVERVQLSLSGGVATRNEHGKDWETLFAAADRALYAAKNAGRNQVVSAAA
jgi:diguanylate cyclase (GGDEF)-like protein